MKKVLTAITFLACASTAHAQEDLTKSDMVRLFGYAVQTDKMCGSNTKTGVALGLRRMGLELDDFPSRPVAANVGMDEAKTDMRRQGRAAFCAQFQKY